MQTGVKTAAELEAELIKLEQMKLTELRACCPRVGGTLSHAALFGRYLRLSEIRRARSRLGRRVYSIQR